MSIGWVPIDKGLVRTLKGLNRPFSYVEAMFSHSVNVNCGNQWSIKGYAEVWQWDRKKVRKFLEEIPTAEGHGACKKGMAKGCQVHLITLAGIGTEQGHNRDTIGTEQGPQESKENNVLQGEENTIGTEQGHNRDTIGDPIIKNKKNNKNNIKEKDTRFNARLFLSERGVLDQHITDWLKIRKDKKLTPTQTALENTEKEAGKANLSLANVLKRCCEEGWGGFKAEWLLKGERNGNNRTNNGKIGGFVEARKSGETDWLG